MQSVYYTQPGWQNSIGISVGEIEYASYVTCQCIGTLSLLVKGVVTTNDSSYNYMKKSIAV